MINKIVFFYDIWLLIEGLSEILSRFSFFFIYTELSLKGIEVTFVYYSATI